jgi:hypothetical protein
MRFLGGRHRRVLQLILPPLLHVRGVIRVPVLVAEHIPVSRGTAMELLFVVVVWWFVMFEVFVIAFLVSLLLLLDDGVELLVPQPSAEHLIL